MGVRSDITGRIQGISQDSFELLRDDLEDIFMEFNWCENTLEIDSYSKHPARQLDDIFNKISFCMDHGQGQLYLHGEGYDDHSVIYFVPGQWREMPGKIVYPTNPFKKPNQTLNIQYIKTAFVHTSEGMIESLLNENVVGQARGEFEFHVNREHLQEQIEDIRNARLREFVKKADSEIDDSVQDICFCT